MKSRCEGASAYRDEDMRGVIVGGPSAVEWSRVARRTRVPREEGKLLVVVEARLAVGPGREDDVDEEGHWQSARRTTRQRRSVTGVF